MSRMSTLLLATAVMMTGQGMVGSSRGGSSQRREPEIIPKPIGDTTVLNEIPKGHKTEKAKFIILHHDNFHYEWVVEYSYGTPKTKERRCNAALRDIQDYMRRVPVEELRRRNEFVRYFSAKEEDSDVQAV